MALPDWSDANVQVVASFIDYWADQYAIPRNIAYGIVDRESQFHANAVGDSGRAMGLMQLWLTTAMGMGYGGDATGLLDPDTNLKWGLLYLRQMLDRFGGDMNIALSAYNGGYRKGMITNPQYVNDVIDRATVFDQLWAGTMGSDPTMTDSVGSAGAGTSDGVPPMLWLVVGMTAVWVLLRGGMV